MSLPLPDLLLGLPEPGVVARGFTTRALRKPTFQKAVYSGYAADGLEDG